MLPVYISVTYRGHNGVFLELFSALLKVSCNRRDYHILKRTLHEERQTKQWLLLFVDPYEAYRAYPLS